MSELKEHPSYSRVAHIAWLEDQLQNVEENIKKLAI